jgi:hypothetical protein
LALCVATLAFAGCSDPVHDDLVQSLGPEDPNVEPGPLHRPGQPCLACHGTEGPAPQFSLGGTVYSVRGQPSPAIGVLVQTEDIGGNYWTVQTNSVGNFYVSEQDFAPAFPIKLTVYSADLTVSLQMQTYAGRDGSCADCHSNPPSRSSVGPVYLYASPPDGGP